MKFVLIASVVVLIAVAALSRAQAAEFRLAETAEAGTAHIQAADQAADAARAHAPLYRPAAANPAQRPAEVPRHLAAEPPGHLAAEPEERPRADAAITAMALKDANRMRARAAATKRAQAALALIFLGVQKSCADGGCNVKLATVGN